MNGTALSRSTMKGRDRARAYRDKRTKRKGNVDVASAVIETKPITPPPSLQLASGLEPNTEPLTEHQAYHLLRRTSFGASPARVREIVGQPANQVVEQLIQAAISAPLPADPSWINMWPIEDYETYFDQSMEWFFETGAGIFRQMTVNPFGEKMALFWHNHFVTAFFEAHEIAPITYRYLTLLRRQSLGNFRTFVEQIGLDRSMLIYLDGRFNEVGAPNENYARELLELFTMGILGPDGTPNYSESDIVEIARALTGYWINDDNEFEVNFEDELHDSGAKTFFGQTGNWGYADVVRIIFEQRAPQIAHFICSKLYQEFVYEAPQADIVAQLAQYFQDSNFDIRPVITRLLQSCHFFDEEVIGAKIKSPVELFGGMIRELNITEGPDILYEELLFMAETMGQLVLQPPNVAGWPGYRTWLTTASIPLRWEGAHYLVNDEELRGENRIDTFVREVHDATDPNAVFRLPVALVRHFLSHRVEALSIEAITAPWAGGQPIPDEIQQEPRLCASLDEANVGRNSLV